MKYCGHFDPRYPIHTDGAFMCAKANEHSGEHQYVWAPKKRGRKGMWMCNFCGEKKPYNKPCPNCFSKNKGEKTYENNGCEGK